MKVYIGSFEFFKYDTARLTWFNHPGCAELITEALISVISPISRSADHARGDNGGVGDTL